MLRVLRLDPGAGNDGALTRFGIEALLILGYDRENRPFRFSDLRGRETWPTVF